MLKLLKFVAYILGALLFLAAFGIRFVVPPQKYFCDKGHEITLDTETMIAFEERNTAMLKILIATVDPYDPAPHRVARLEVTFPCKGSTHIIPQLQQ